MQLGESLGSQVTESRRVNAIMVYPRLNQIMHQA